MSRKAEVIPAPFDDPLDLDALAGDWFAAGADPHYADLPCYVPLEDDDDAFCPFGDEAPPTERAHLLPRRAYKS